MGNDIVGVFSGQTAVLTLGGMGPSNITISIYGPSGAVRYNPPGTVQLEYYSPKAGTTVRKIVPIGGGYSSSIVTVTTGSILKSETWAGTIKVTPVEVRIDGWGWWVFHPNPAVFKFPSISQHD